MNPRASAFVAFTDSATAGHAADTARSAPSSPESYAGLRYTQMRAKAHPLTLFLSNLRAAISD